MAKTSVWHKNKNRQNRHAGKTKSMAQKARTFKLHSARRRDGRAACVAQLIMARTYCRHLNVFVKNNAALFHSYSILSFDNIVVSVVHGEKKRHHLVSSISCWQRATRAAKNSLIQLGKAGRRRKEGRRKALLRAPKRAICNENRHRRTTEEYIGENNRQWRGMAAWCGVSCHKASISFQLPSPTITNSIPTTSHYYSLPSPSSTWIYQNFL